MNKGSIVFVLEQTEVDVSPAKEYGRIAHVFRPNERRPSIWTPEFREELLETFVEMGYDPENDYVVIAGRMVPLVKMVATLVAEYRTIRVLFYVSSEERYIVQRIGQDVEETSSAG